MRVKWPPVERFLPFQLLGRFSNRSALSTNPYLTTADSESGYPNIELGKHLDCIQTAPCTDFHSLLLHQNRKFHSCESFFSTLKTVQRIKNQLHAVSLFQVMVGPSSSGKPERQGWLSSTCARACADDHQKFAAAFHGVSSKNVEFLDAKPFAVFVFRPAGNMLIFR